MLNTAEEWIHNIKYKTFDRVKYFIQRGQRGFSDEDVWDFDHYLANVIPAGIRELKRIHHGIPNDVMMKYENIKNISRKKVDELAEKEWCKILDEIADGFEIQKIIIGPDVSKLQIKQLQAKFSQATKLFEKYFTYLWD